MARRNILSLYSASSLKSGFFSFLVKVANSAIISQVCVIESYKFVLLYINVILTYRQNHFVGLWLLLWL